MLPIYFILVNSLKTPLDFATSSISFPTHFEWSNYTAAWQQINEPILNSIVVVVISVFFIVLFSTMSAFAFAKLSFPGKSVLFFFIFSLLLIPGFLTLIPLYLQIKKLGLSNSYWALILPYIAGGQAFTIFVLKTFFEQLSTELFEAARIDGAGNMVIYRSIVLPLSIPICTTLGIMNINSLWNDYLLPSLLLDQAHQTLTLALVSFQTSAAAHGLSDYGGMMAAYIVASIPLLVLFSVLMRNFVEGIASGSIKM
jgi:ABC-type glycerol-3-phosphate transport system permease component